VFGIAASEIGYIFGVKGMLSGMEISPGRSEKVLA
jgi:hypothetical protein